MAAALSINGSPPEELTILVVEDEVLLRADLGDALRDAGYKVVEASNADAARDMIESPMRMHLVCTDIRMPGRMNGLGLARWIKTNRPALPVIVISGEATARHSAPIADAVFTKPVDYDRLIDRIGELLAPLRRSSGSGQ